MAESDERFWLLYENNDDGSKTVLGVFGSSAEAAQRRSTGRAGEVVAVRGDWDRLLAHLLATLPDPGSGRRRFGSSGDWGGVVRVEALARSDADLVEDVTVHGFTLDDLVRRPTVPRAEPG